MVAFQAADPGSTPGQRTVLFFSFIIQIFYFLREEEKGEKSIRTNLFLKFIILIDRIIGIPSISLYCLPFLFRLLKTHLQKQRKSRMKLFNK